MVKKYRLIMGKRILNNSGFTLIEILFVVSIMMFICLIELNIRPYQINVDNEINNISLFLLEAKSNAMIHKEDVEISFCDNYIDVTSNHLNKQYVSKTGYFTRYKLSYNEQGHIVNPKSIYFFSNNHKFTFVFQIGTGCFYVEK